MHMKTTIDSFFKLIEDVYNLKLHLVTDYTKDGCGSYLDNFFLYEFLF